MTEFNIQVKGQSALKELLAGAVLTTCDRYYRFDKVLNAFYYSDDRRGWTLSKMELNTFLEIIWDFAEEEEK